MTGWHNDPRSTGNRPPMAADDIDREDAVEQLDWLVTLLATARYGESSRAAVDLMRADVANALRDYGAQVAAGQEQAARDEAAAGRLRAGFEQLAAEVDAARERRESGGMPDGWRADLEQIGRARHPERAEGYGRGAGMRGVGRPMGVYRGHVGGWQSTRA